MRTVTKRIITFCIVALVSALALGTALKWIATPMDNAEVMRRYFPGAVARAAAVALCSVHPEQPGPHLVIEEIWKQPLKNDKINIGASILLKPPHDPLVHTPSKAVVFFRPPVTPREKGLQEDAIWYFDGDLVLLSPRITISQIKAMCLGTPGT